jgi:hypothetical protein
MFADHKQNNLVDRFLSILHEKLRQCEIAYNYEVVPDALNCQKGRFTARMLQRLRKQSYKAG